MRFSLPLKTFFAVVIVTMLLVRQSPAQQPAAQQPAAQQPPAEQQSAPAQKPPAPQLQEWLATFEGGDIDPARWEKFSFAGDPGVSVKVEKGELHMRGVNNSRAGIRSKPMFSGERFIVDAKLAKVGKRLPTRDSADDTGFAVVALLFGGSDLNRLEWILRSDGRLEAWLMRANEPSQQLDNHKLGIKFSDPTLGIARKGDDFLFLVNGEVGMQKNIPGFVKDFKVMLYGFGSSQNDWRSVRVVTPQQK